MPTRNTAQDSRQMELPYSLLETNGRSVLTVAEIAEQLCCTPRHVTSLIDSGELVAIDISGKGTSRMRARVPVEAWRDFVVRSVSAPLPKSPLRHLPANTLLRLYHELAEHLRAKGIPLHR